MAVEQAAHPAPSGWKDAPRKRSLNGASYTVAGGSVVGAPSGRSVDAGAFIDETRALRREPGGTGYGYAENKKDAGLRVVSALPALPAPERT